MCSKEIIQKIDNGELLLVKKLHLLLLILVIIIGFTSAFAVVRENVNNHEKRIRAMEYDHVLIREIQANVKQLVEKNKLVYIEVEK